MKMHLDSIEKGDPKPGFGRTDIKEDLDEGANKRQLMKVSDHLTKLMSFNDMDKKDYGRARDFVEKGDMKSLERFTMRLDTEPKEQIVLAVAKGLGKKQAEDIFGIKIDSSAIKESSARRDAMRAMRKDKEVDPADIDDIATDDDVKAASKNIIMQLRKSVSLRGNFPVEFMDKKKVKVDAKIAAAVQDKYNSMKKASDKEKFQVKIAKSYKDMLSALKEGFASDAQRRAAFASGYKEKGKKKKEDIDEAGFVGRKDPMPAGKELAKLMKKKGKKKKESTILDRIDQKVQERKNG